MRDRAPQEVSIDDVDEFSLYRTIADEDPYPYSDSLHLDFLEQFGAEDVRAVLARLPDLYRVPMLLVYVDGFATKEVAGMVDAPLGTVLARLHRGRKLFERELWDYAETNGLPWRRSGDHLRRGGQAALGVPRRRAGPTPERRSRST